MSVWSAVRSRYSVNAEPLRTERLLELGVIIAIVLLLCVLVSGVIRLLSVDTIEPVPPAADSLGVGKIIVRETVAAESRQAITARPLFWSSRRPAAGTEAPAPKREKAAVGSHDIESATLKGVFGSGDTAGVIVVFEGKRRRVMHGEDMDGWRLREIEPRSASFSRAGRTAVLTLKTSEAAAPEGLEEVPPQNAAQDSGEAAASVATGNQSVPASPSPLDSKTTAKRNKTESKPASGLSLGGA